MWIILRVSLQTILFSSTGSHSEYKAFVAFLVTKIASNAALHDISSERMHFIKAKLARRLGKLEGSISYTLSQKLLRAIQKLDEIMQQRWTHILSKHAMASPWNPESLDIHKDTNLSLTNSREYLQTVLAGNRAQHSTTTFEPNHYRRFTDTDVFSLPSTALQTLFAENGQLALSDFEQIVETCIDDWVAKDLHEPSRCSKLATCIDEYRRAASPMYASSPEDMSIMILTIFDMWVALDKHVLAQFPLMAHYIPEVPIDLLEPLLLRRGPSMDRFSRIQQYLRDRYARATNKQSVFDVSRKATSLAVQFYDSSAELRGLRDQIVADANSQRQAKIRELQQLKKEYEDLKSKASVLDCEYLTDYRSGYDYHSRWCEKCSLNSKRNNLHISLHEWPLPRDHNAEKEAIFELRPPAGLAIWRDITYSLLRDLCSKTERESASPNAFLQTYPGLQSYVYGAASRVTVASNTKSFMQTHYHPVFIYAASESNVLVENGLNFKSVMIYVCLK